MLQSSRSSLFNSPNSSRRAGAELVDVEPHLLSERHEEVREWRIVDVIMSDIASVFEAPTRDDNRQIAGAVAARVAEV